MIKLPIWAAALLLLAACNNNNQTGAEPNGTANVDTVQTEPQTEATRLQTTFSDLFAYMQAQDASFAAEKFTPGLQSKWDPLPAQPIDGVQLKPFEPFLIYNSDSTKAIDLYSYNYIITRRKGELNMEEAGPDTEIALVDLTANTRKRIFFSGPSVTVFEAKWNGDDEIIMAGAEQLQNNQVKPVIWQYHLSDSVMQTLTYDEALAVDINEYKKKKKPVVQTNL